MTLFANSQRLSRDATNGSLLGRLAHGDHLPEDFTTGCPLEHADVALLSADFLVKAFEQIGRADSRHVRPGKVDRHITHGLRKAVHTRLDRLALSRFPWVLQGLSTGAHVDRDVGGIHLAGIGQDGLCGVLFGLATRSGRRLGVRCHQRRLLQVIGDMFALVQETALMGHAPERTGEGLFKTLPPIAHEQWCRLFRAPVGVQGPAPRPPGPGILPGSPLPGEHLPVAICPEAQRRQHAPLFLVFARALSPHSVTRDVARGHRQLAPQPLHSPEGRWRLTAGGFTGVGPLSKAQPQAVTGVKAEPLAPGQGHGFLQGTQTLAQRIRQQLLSQQRTPAACIPLDALPMEGSVASAELGHTAIKDTAVLGPQLPLRRPTAGGGGTARPQAAFLALTAERVPDLFIERVFKRPFYARHDPRVDLRIHSVVYIARPGRSVHNLPIVGTGASVMKRRCMAHRDILS